MSENRPKTKKNRWWILLAVLIVVMVLAGLMLLPWNISGLTSNPHPVQGYAEAVQRLDAMLAAEKPDMNPLCKLQFLTHGAKTERAIILVHGYTNCPQQFHDLGQIFYDAGYNVLIAPLPRHGLSDRMTTEHSQMTAEELAIYADAVVDIAHGLGDKVVMMGISAGGVITAWAAQNRPELDLAIIISPAFGFNQIPTPLTAVVMNGYNFLLPDSYEWWNPEKKADLFPTYTYPRYSTHALAQTLRLGFAAQASIRSRPPAAKKVIAVINANDTQINNELYRQVIGNWQSHTTNFSTYEFEASLKLSHDMIDPNDDHQQVEIVYPRLFALANQ